MRWKLSHGQQLIDAICRLSLSRICPFLRRGSFPRSKVSPFSGLKMQLYLLCVEQARLCRRVVGWLVDDVARGVARGRTGFVSSWVGGRAGADSEVRGWFHGERRQART